MGHVLLVNAAAIVGDFHFDHGCVFINHTHGEHKQTSLPHCVHGVQNEVQKGLLQHGRVDLQEGNVIGETGLHLDLFICDSLLPQRQGMSDDLPDIGRFLTRRGRSGKDQDVVNELFQMFDLPKGDLESFQIIAGRMHPLFQDLEAHLDRGKRISHFMGDACRKLTHRRHLLALIETLFEILEIGDIPLDDYVPVAPPDRSGGDEERPFRSVPCLDLDLIGRKDSVFGFLPSCLHEAAELRGDDLQKMFSPRLLGNHPDPLLYVPAHVMDGSVAAQDEQPVGQAVHNGLKVIVEGFDLLPEVNVFLKLVPEGFGIFPKVFRHLFFFGHILERLDGGDDLPFFIIDGGRQKIEMPILPSEVPVEVPCLKSGLHGRRFPDLLGPIMLLNALEIPLEDQVGNDGPFFVVKGNVLFFGPDHLTGRKSGQFRTGPVPEDDFVIPVQDEDRDGRPLDDSLDGLLLPDQPFLPVFPLPKPVPDLPGMKPSPARIDDGHCGDDHRQDKTGGPDHDVEEDFPDEGRGAVIGGHNRHGPGLGCESDRGIGHDRPLRTALLPLQPVFPVSLFSGKKGLSKRRQIRILPKLQRSRVPADHAVTGMKQNRAAPVQKPG